ncbi:type I polyketide synthase [Streptomyces sp. NPDC059740]|uniref:type I polyketide synthase n=1 Tax=Streptomyces sp. NPDC059740 TaxID=3346926 RepID=UPI00364CE02D
MELPTYPFQHTRYWPDTTPVRTAQVNDPDLQWRYRASWNPVTQPPAPAQLSGTWLLVGTTTASAPAAAALADHGAEVVHLDPAGMDRAALSAALPRTGTGLSGVVSLLAFDETPDPAHPDLPRGTARTLTLVQALGDAGIDAPLWLLTRGAVATGPAEPVPHPAQAQTWGLGRVACLEHPERWGGLVDLPTTWDERTGSRLAAVLAGIGTEGRGHGAGHEDQVAVRPSGVAARRLERAAASAPVAPWTPRGTVLITGGTGALAGHVARWLTDRGAPHLVLAGRTGPTAPGTATLVAELAARGTTVDVVACDIARRAETAALLAAHDDLSAVLHTAGVGQSSALADTTLADQAAVVRAKALGARWLDELTADRDLDAFVLFSSIAATWGSAGQSGYAAANAHADAVCDARRARGLAATSIAWGLWDGDGLGAGADGTQVQRRGVRPMDPAVAVNALARAVDAGEGVLTVADIDWDVFAPTFTLRRPSPLLDGLPDAVTALTEDPAGTPAPQEPTDNALATRLAGAARADQEEMLVDLVRSRTAAVLGHTSAADVDPARTFKDLGFDSLTSMELRDRLSEATGLRLPATLVFDHPTPTALATLLRSSLLGEDAAEAATTAATDTGPATGEAAHGEPIAIVGLGLRLPGGAGTPEQLWELLSSGTDAIAGFPTDRGWRPPDGDYTRSGGFLRDAAEFDPAFFGISPREALAMDPQQRLLLEISWEALERAGLDPTTLKGTRTGVFAGAAASGYGTGTALATESDGHLMTGASTSVLSGRVSYTLGLEGPAVTVDTACSSALVALHLAVRSLRGGECDLALAGGVTVMSSPDVFAEFARQRVLAADGRCKAFSARADGTAWAEGAGVVAVERLADAHRHGHRVLAVIRGTAANQDGASNGLTAPSGPSQQRVIRAALADARLSAADVDAVEAHGTGTELGDPIEAQALLATYGRERPGDRPLWLGSIKSNIGHSQQAAGIAGVIKMVLALQHDRLPRTLHAEDPSPHVDWSTGSVRLLQEPVAWPPDDGRPRRAGVSAFGISGTNVHVVLEEAPTAPAAQPQRLLPAVLPATDTVPWVLSGYDATSLAAQSGRLREHALAHPALQPADVAWSLVTTRTTFEHRAVVLGAGREPLTAGLAAVATGQPAPGVVTGTAAAGGVGRTVFVFPGQGSQWVGMGRELAQSSPVFAARLAECGRALSPYVDWELDDVLAGLHGFEAADVVQPALWAVMVSLAAVWQAAGVRPDAVVGHSQGEIAAATVAGILSLEDAAKVVALRSRTLRALAGRGGMMAVAQDAATVREWIAGFGDRLSVAAVNGPRSTVVSGEPEALRELAAAHEGTRTRILPVDYASHSAHVDELRADILTALDGIAPHEGHTPMVSAMSGESISGPELDAAYWYASLRETVEFERAVRSLGESGHGVFVEVSPHPVLTGAIGDALEEAAPVVVGTLRRDDGDAVRLLTSFADAYVHGVHVDWPAVLGHGTTVDLPTYAFHRTRYWPEPADQATPTATGEEAGFWAAVERGDAERLAGILNLDTDDAETEVGGLLSALTSWRRRERADSSVADWRYRITWAPIADTGTPLSGTWLLIGSDEEVAAALTAGGARILTVDVTDTDLTDRASLSAALRTTLARHTDPATPPDLRGVVSLLALDESPDPAYPAVPRGLSATLALVQALGDADLDAPMWALTRGAVTTGPDDPAPSGTVQAQTWALGRVVALEHPDRWGGLVDLPPTLDARDAARLTAVLSGGGAPHEDQVALRPTGAFARRLVRAPDVERGGTWTPRGTVLVTGGTGAVGGHVGRWSAGRAAARTVLTSRTGPTAAGAVVLAAELAAVGTAVDIHACDITDRKAVAALLHRIDATGPALSSVVHAAGVGRGGSVDATTTADLAEVAAAKALGARWLDELTADRELDAFVLFSSGAAAWGSSLQPGYAAANARLDALADRRRALGRPATAVAWGLWGGGGMGEGEAGEQLSRYGLRAMDPERAVRALGQALDADLGALVVADIDWDVFAPAFTLRRPSPLLSTLPEAGRALAAAAAAADAAATAGTGTGGGWTERLAGRPRAEQRRLLIELVRSEAAATLGHTSPTGLPPGRAFRKLGFDSVMAVDLRNRLSAATGLRLSATLVFDHPNPNALADHLRAELVGDDGDAQQTDPVLSGLDQLETALADVPGGSASRKDITARLRAVLAHWLGDGTTDRSTEQQQEAVAGRLDDASAVEVLDFINKELGLS